MAAGELASRVIVLDSSGIIALFRAKDKFHKSASAAVQASLGILVVPAGVLSETSSMIERWSGFQHLDDFLGSVEDGTVTLDCGDRDIPRIRQLVARYQNLPLGFADASVIACAERRGGKVLTYDQRHFPVVAREGTFEILGA